MSLLDSVRLALEEVTEVQSYNTLAEPAASSQAATGKPKFQKRRARIKSCKRSRLSFLVPWVGHLYLTRLSDSRFLGQHRNVQLDDADVFLRLPG